jgi:hypothetical protein
MSFGNVLISFTYFPYFWEFFIDISFLVLVDIFMNQTITKGEEKDIEIEIRILYLHKYIERTCVYWENKTSSYWQIWHVFFSCKNKKILEFITENTIDFYFFGILYKRGGDHTSIRSNLRTYLIQPVISCHFLSSSCHHSDHRWRYMEWFDDEESIKDEQLHNRT